MRNFSRNYSIIFYRIYSLRSWYSVHFYIIYIHVKSILDPNDPNVSASKITGNQSCLEKKKNIRGHSVYVENVLVFFCSRYDHTEAKNTIGSISFIATTIRRFLRFASDKLYTSGSSHLIHKKSAPIIYCSFSFS